MSTVRHLLSCLTSKQSLYFSDNSGWISDIYECLIQKVVFKDYYEDFFNAFYLFLLPFYVVCYKLLAISKGVC